MCKSITCIILGVFNIAMLIGGLALLTLGALMRWNKPLLRKIFEHVLEFIQNRLNAQVSDQAQLAIDRIQEFAGPFAMIVFIGGICITIVAGLAFVGLCCDIRSFLTLYAIIVAVVFLAHAIVLIIYFANKDLILRYAHQYLKEAVFKYTSMSSASPESALLTVIMPSIGCCGFDSAADFNAQEAKFNGTDVVGNVTFTNITYPVPCCNLDMELKDEDGFCPRTFSSNNSFIDYGCKVRMEKDFFDKIALGSLIVLLFIGVVLVLTIIQLRCAG